MQCIITTPQSIVEHTTISMISLPTLQGRVTILPNHQPMVIIITQGTITYSQSHHDQGGIEGYQLTKGSYETSGGMCYIDQKELQIVLHD